MTKLFAYNLEFEDHCEQMNIAGYTFTRLPDYASSLHKLHHTARIIHEFDVKPTTGTHVATAEVVTPAKENRAVLPWAAKRTALADIELLLSILTWREVFCLAALKPDGAIIRDPRQHRFGMSVRTALNYEPSPPDRYVFLAN